MVATVALAACGDGDSAIESTDEPYDFPAAPSVPEGPLTQSVADAAGVLADKALSGDGGTDVDDDALEVVATSGDPRLAWLVQDLLRFIQTGDDHDDLVAAFVTLTGSDPDADPTFDGSPWQSVADHLIAWDLPAPPGYRELKASVFLDVVAGWEPFFADADSTIDWRLVSWGGVGIDDRALGDPDPCPAGCIPALDDPALTEPDPEDGGWYPDDEIVFGIVEDGDAVALPKNIMQVHEMVNLTLGGRRLGIPYCTLCGSAQAYYTDRTAAGTPTGTDDALVLRTSGLLSRSNKVMYDLGTSSVFDTFTGTAVSGPLHAEGLVLEQTTVVVSTWGEWRAAHPDTGIVAEDGGIGRDYPDDPLGDRDDDGPIFPIGPVDERLPVQAAVLGVIAPDGTAVAFDAERATAALGDGDAVQFAGVELVADGDGLRARRADDGSELAAHEAFWFAWSQFHPDTVVWTSLDRSTASD